MMTRRPARFGARRARLAGLLVTTVALAPVLTSCANNRPPKPTCQSGYQANWDGDDHRWECEPKTSRSGGSSGHRTRTRSHGRH